MKKKEIFINNLSNLYTDCYDGFNKIDNQIFNIYVDRYNFLNNEYRYLMKLEPLNFFKKSHKQWEDKIIKLKNEIEDILEKISNNI